MALPITVPYTFGNATTAIPLSNLDSDYATVYQAVNGIGNGSVALANVTISGVSTPITATQGGTGNSSVFTANALVYAPTTSTLATGSALQFDGANLGLGVTPVAGYTYSKLIQVASSVWQARTGTPDTFQLFANGYLNSGATAYNYIGTGNATRYDQAGGQHQWFTAPSGTAGNAISFTQAATLTANGNYLLGTTTEPVNRKSGNTYLALGSSVIEGTPYTTVSTTAIQLSRISGTGIIAMVTGYNTANGAQGTWLVLVGGAGVIVASSSDGTGTVPTFAVVSAYLTMKTTSGTLSVVCQIFTSA